MLHTVLFYFSPASATTPAPSSPHGVGIKICWRVVLLRSASARQVMPEQKKDKKPLMRTWITFTCTTAEDSNISYTREARMKAHAWVKSRDGFRRCFSIGTRFEWRQDRDPDSQPYTLYPKTMWHLPEPYTLYPIPCILYSDTLCPTPHTPYPIPHTI